MYLALYNKVSFHFISLLPNINKLMILADDFVVVKAYQMPSIPTQSLHGGRGGSNEQLLNGNRF